MRGANAMGITVFGTKPTPISDLVIDGNTIFDCEPAPMLLGFVLGPMMEENLRRAMLQSRGEPTVFFTHPLSLAFIIATVLILIVMAAPMVRRRRAEITG